MKLRVFGPDGQSNPTMEQAVRRNIWAAVRHPRHRPDPRSASVGLVRGVICLMLIVMGINSDP